MFGKKATPQYEIGSLIGGSTTVSGDITFAGGLRIDGTVKGSVRSTEGEKNGLLVVSEHGRIEGEVCAAHLIVGGSIRGPVNSGQLLELQPKARIVGDVRYTALELHHGAVVEGMMIHIPSETVADPRANAPEE